VNATASFCYPATNVLLQHAERHMAGAKHTVVKFGEGTEDLAPARVDAPTWRRESASTAPVCGVIAA
jgi:hypothetical protein